MATKLKDIAAKTGEYTDRDGNTKGRWQNVGSLMQGDGGEFIILNRWFNPAGMPNPDNRDSIVLSCFEPKEGGGQRQHSAPAQQSKPAPADDIDDSDIPF